MKTQISKLFLEETKGEITLKAELFDGRTARTHHAVGTDGGWVTEWEIEKQSCPACGQEIKSCGGYDRCRYVNGC